MKTGLFLLSFLLLSCSFKGRREVASSSIDLVFDLDWTLVSEVTQAPQKIKYPYISVEGKVYRVHDGVVEAMELLLERPQVRVSFFSGGQKSRNEELLKKIQLKNGESLFDISHKVLSFDDLSDTGLDETHRFSQRYKKDLTKINKDTSQLVIFDDNHFFAKNSKQQSHFLWLGPTYEHLEQFVPGNGEYHPGSQRIWSYQRNRIALIIDAIDQGFSGPADFFSNIRSTWDSYETESGQINKKALEALYRGKKRLNAISSKAISVPIDIPCFFQMNIILLP